jgi:hypothetical protein
MALTINPAVSRVSYRRWAFHVGLFAFGLSLGALATYAFARAVYAVTDIVGPGAWLAVALPLLAVAAMRDLGFQAPVPYPARRQVPEWFRRISPPGLTAIVYGGQLGTGFLTRFTYSTHAAFVVLLATQSSAGVVIAGIGAFALSKCIVVASSPAGKSYPAFEERLFQRHRVRGQTVLRLANAALTIAAAGVLIINL